MLLSGAVERWRFGVEGVYIFSLLVRLDAFQHKRWIIHGTADLQNMKTLRWGFDVSCLPHEVECRLPLFFSRLNPVLSASHDKPPCQIRGKQTLT